MGLDGRMKDEITTGFVLRHVVAVVLLSLSWRLLSLWYYYQDPFYYVVFAALFVVGLAAAGWSLIHRIRDIPLSRILIVSGILLFVFPWGEFLKLNHDPTSREDWTRQIFKQTVFLYALLLLFRLYPKLAILIQDKTLRVLQFLSSKRYLLRLPPLLFFCLSVFIGIFVFRQTPLVQDSAAHLFQAKVFSELKLYTPVPPVPDFFSFQADMLVMKDDRWFSMYPPGFAFLLAAVMPIRAEWFVCSLLGALTLGIWISYTCRWHSPHLAVLVGILGLASPFLLAMSATMMVHTPELLIASSIIYLCRLQSEESKPWHAAALLLLLTFGILVRAFSLLVFLTPALLYTGWSRIKRRSYLLPAVMIAGIAAGSLIQAYYQWKTTGNPLVSGYLLEYPDLRLGFGEMLGGEAHTPARGMENLSNSILGMNFWLTGWHSGSLFFVMIFFLVSPKFSTWDKILLLGSGMLLLFYYFYFFQDLILGPRFLFVLAPFLLLLIARSTSLEKPIVTALLLASLFVSLPQRISTYVRRYDPAAHQSGLLKEQIGKLGKTKSLVFLDRQVSQKYVGWNDPFLRDPVVLCRDLKSRNREAIDVFPGYRTYYFRPNLEFSMTEPIRGFSLYDEPEKRIPGHISLFQLAMSLQTAGGQPDNDLFDICYADFFTSPGAAHELKYLLEQLQSPVPENENEYKRNFKRGIIHAGRMLLLPKLSLEEKGKNWNETLDRNRFRMEYGLSLNAFRASGEVGKIIAHEMEKVGRRIDRNRNGRFSDQEIDRFLSDKLRLL